MNNPLLDKDFLKELDEFRSHEIYARITALSTKELPIEYIEGKVTGVEGYGVFLRRISYEKYLEKKEQIFQKAELTAATF